jgi:small subunit ribosomal protein S16
MATKIRLQRHGKKKSAFYHIVAADSKAKRDGRFIEKLGTYNPNTNPATIELDFERAMYWVQVGAEPTDTAKALLSYTGVLLKNHLDKGVAKGALSQADADKKFEAWKAEKDSKISGKTDGLEKAKKEAAEKAMAAEKAVQEARAAEIAAKNAPPVVEEEATEAPAEDAEAKQEEE